MYVGEAGTKQIQFLLFLGHVCYQVKSKQD